MIKCALQTRCGSYKQRYTASEAWNSIKNCNNELAIIYFLEFDPFNHHRVYSVVFPAILQSNFTFPASSLTVYLLVSFLLRSRITLGALQKIPQTNLPICPKYGN